MNINDHILINPVLHEIRSELLDETLVTILETQTFKGLMKYNRTVNPVNLSSEEWLKHLLEELMDATVYTKSLIASFEMNKSELTLDEKVFISYLNSTSTVVNNIMHDLLAKRRLIERI